MLQFALSQLLDLCGHLIVLFGDGPLNCIVIFLTCIRFTHLIVVKIEIIKSTTSTYIARTCYILNLAILFLIALQSVDIGVNSFFRNPKKIIKFFLSFDLQYFDTTHIVVGTLYRSQQK